MFISIFAASCRPHNIIGFLDNLAETAADPHSFEVLIKLDEGDEAMIELLENYQKRAAFTLKYLATPKLDGYYTLDVGYNELLKIADPETYFCWLLTDEIRLQTKGWDDILKKYIHIYPDDIFRIKLSVFQSKNYIDFFECLPYPDNYAVTTRKWLEVTEGWGHFWGPDSWHQCVDYYLGLCKDQFHPFGIWRSFPVFDINVGGQEAGQGIDNPDSMIYRLSRIDEGWCKHSTHAAQENFNRLAQRLHAHIYAAATHVGEYEIKEYKQTKSIALFAKHALQPVRVWKYKLPGLRLRLMIGYKKARILRDIPFLSRIRRKGKFVFSTLKVKTNRAVNNPNTWRISQTLIYQPLLSSFNFISRLRKR